LGGGATTRALPLTRKSSPPKKAGRSQIDLPTPGAEWAQGGVVALLGDRRWSIYRFQARTAQRGDLVPYWPSCSGVRSSCGQTWLL